MKIISHYNTTKMYLLDNKYYMIRNGDFATNANTKIIYGFVSGVLCIDDYVNRNSSDCIMILVTSTTVWSCVEFYLHISKTREIKPMYIMLGNHKQILPQSLGIILQAFQEGGFISTLGLYFGDRLYEMKSQVHMHMFIMLVVMNIFMKKNKMKSSKRQVNTRTSLVLIGGASVYNMYVCYNHPEHIERQLSMFCAMVYICSYWTFFAWYRGFRSIEIHEPKKIGQCDQSDGPIQTYGVRPANYWETFCVMAYDVIFEIGMAYAFFYNITLV